MNLDLWAENQFDNAPGNVAPPGVLRRGYPASQRRLETAAVSSLREWLLNDYTAAYCRMLRVSPLYRRCYWIDAWDTDTRSPTLPVIEKNSEPAHTQKRAQKASVEQKLPAYLQPIAQLSSKLAGECPSRPFILHGIAIKEQAARKSAGATVPGQPAIPKESGIVQAGWHDCAPSLLAAIEQSPAIFLLNPFASTPLTQDDLLPLYQRTNAPTEVCLLLSQVHTQRFVTSAARNTSEATALTALLRTDRWKTLQTTQADASSALVSDGVIEMLRAAMQKHIPFVQRITIPLIRGAGVIAEAPYTLLFATRRKDSLMCMNDAVCLHRRQLEEDSYQGLLSEAWFAQQQQERLAQESQALYEETLLVGSKQRIRRWPDLRQHLLLARFGRFTLSEYDAVIKQLLQEGKVACQWRQRGQETGDMQPGIDDILLWM